MAHIPHALGQLSSTPGSTNVRSAFPDWPDFALRMISQGRIGGGSSVAPSVTWSIIVLADEKGYLALEAAPAGHGTVQDDLDHIAFALVPTFSSPGGVFLGVSPQTGEDVFSIAFTQQGDKWATWEPAFGRYAPDGFSLQLRSLFLDEAPPRFAPPAPNDSLADAVPLASLTRTILAQLLPAQKLDDPDEEGQRELPLSARAQFPNLFSFDEEVL